FRVNIDPSERYTLSVPGSTEARVACADTGVENLLIAGDWTWNPVLNAGCVEATVASGMEASRVFTDQPEIAGADRRRPSASVPPAPAVLDEVAPPPAPVAAADPELEPSPSE